MVGDLWCLSSNNRLIMLSPMRNWRTNTMIQKNWRIWKKRLIYEIGVGWSSELETISATDE
jgi:hypothetical protein